MTAEEFQRAFRRHALPKRAEVLLRFFHTEEGGYGEGDKFLGMSVPVTRAAIRPFRAMPHEEVIALLQSEWHEERLAALLLWVHRMPRATEDEQRRIFRDYLAQTSRVNNWDLVDASAPGVVGLWLRERSRAPLWKLANSKVHWDRRIAIVATLHFIKCGDTAETFALAEALLGDGEDLMHKAVGWALREAGKKNREGLVRFLRDHAAAMPRTMLRYSIERFPEPERKAILRGEW